MIQARYLRIADAIIGLQDRGFELDFTLVNDNLSCPQLDLIIPAREFDIMEMYYFRRCKDCLYEKMVFGIVAAGFGMKGILITGEGNDSAFPDTILKKISCYILPNQRLYHSGIL